MAFTVEELVRELRNWPPAALVMIEQDEDHELLPLEHVSGAAAGQFSVRVVLGTAVTK